MTMRQILVNVWQKVFTPHEALEELEKNHYRFTINRAEVLDLLEEVAQRKISVTAFLNTVSENEKQRA